MSRSGEVAGEMTGGMTGEMTGEMTQDQAVLVCRRLSAAGVRYWLVGGWGVDALVGRQTRRHRDVDLLVDACDERLTLEQLAALGYAVETDSRPIRVEVGAPGSGWVDVHPVVFDERGHGVQAGPDDTVYDYPVGVLTTGRLGPLTVGCVTADLQRRAHEGYAPRLQDSLDLALLAEL